MVRRELLQGQKLLGWVLIVVGLALLILIGLAESLERRYSASVVVTYVSGNHTMLGVVAWLLLASGYVFVLSARLEERLRDIAGEFEERVDHLRREVAALQQRIGDRPVADHPEGTPGALPVPAPARDDAGEDTAAATLRASAPE
jgi:thiosulfate reductase cytochrome b subunit